jgi:peptidoglycan/LPS O-acetylase OafA/YrhL
MAEHSRYFSVLDGWRGLSILFVLSAHLLPLGPKHWQLNSTFGPMGMALFFTLSGFLITNFLIQRGNVADFMLRRLVRIVPLAWLYMAVALVWINAPTVVWVKHLLFYANLPPIKLTDITAHLWSLCVEMQFYFSIALLFLLFRKKGLLLIPVICIGVTLFRAYNGIHINIVTYYRIDEILVGCILALAFNNYLGRRLNRLIEIQNIYFLLLLFVVSCHPEGGFMNYFRPYLAALLVGCTLFNGQSFTARVLSTQPILVYIAAISYSLYVIHPLLGHTWLGSGEGWDKYAKRPLLFGLLFALSHLSTYYYEKKCIMFGKRISAKWFTATA